MNRTVMGETDAQTVGKSFGGPLLTKALGVAIALGGTHAWAQQAPAAPLPDNSSTPPPGKENATQLGKVSVEAEDLEPSAP